MNEKNFSDFYKVPDETDEITGRAMGGRMTYQEGSLMVPPEREGYSAAGKVINTITSILKKAGEEEASCCRDGGVGPSFPGCELARETGDGAEPAASRADSFLLLFGKSWMLCVWW